MKPDPSAPAPPPSCTFKPEDWRRLARHWYPIIPAADVGATPKAAALLDENLVIYRSGGELVVARDVCPHRGVPLSLGRPESGSQRIKPS